jgi:precorrin-8X/cobalt-precorrin-8 methylmutase
MSKESSHRGDTTENTYTDLGAHTREAFEISEKSRKLARKIIGNQTVEDRVRQRCSVAVGDFAMADLLAFRLDPVNAGISALERGAPLICDIRMVQVGIQKKGHRSDVLCALDYGSDLAIKEGITRTSAGFRTMQDRLDGAVIVIGNAPSALLSVCEMIGQGIVPALVVGTPVGFVNAAESKEELRKLPVPSISNTGTRGGTPVAVAAINEIITIFSEISKEKEQ